MANKASLGDVAAVGGGYVASNVAAALVALPFVAPSVQAGDTSGATGWAVKISVVYGAVATVLGGWLMTSGRAPHLGAGVLVSGIQNLGTGLVASIGGGVPGGAPTRGGAMALPPPRSLVASLATTPAGAYVR